MAAIMTAIDRVIATALKEDGYCEKATNSQLDSKTANAGSGNWTKYAKTLDNLGVYNGKKNGYAWCDVFVDYVFITTFGLDIGMKMLNQPMGGLGAGCTSSAQYFKNINRFYKSNPQPGDQIFFTADGGKSMNHTGLVIKVANGKVYTIEGNTSATAGVVANGGMVRQKSYALNYNRIGGYGRPKWVLVQEETTEMTQDQFNKMFAVAYASHMASLHDNDASGWSKAGRDFATTTGIVKGGNPLPNGEPSYNWESPVTVEQMSVMLQRMATHVPNFDYGKKE